MLNLRDGNPFSTGRSTFLDRVDSSAEPTAKIWVRIEPDRLGMEILAQLDTGAAWSILEPDVARELSLLNGQGEPITLKTRYGLIGGHLERVQIDIIAEEGDALSVEATVFISQQWPGGSFLGFNGLLDHIRFAIDPSDNSFHFGLM